MIPDAVHDLYLELTPEFVLTAELCDDYGMDLLEL